MDLCPKNAHSLKSAEVQPLGKTRIEWRGAVIFPRYTYIRKTTWKRDSCPVSKWKLLPLCLAPACEPCECCCFSWSCTGISGTSVGRHLNWQSCHCPGICRDTPTYLKKIEMLKYSDLPQIASKCTRYNHLLGTTSEHFALPSFIVRRPLGLCGKNGYIFEK